jgi:hypothetical protein
MSESNIRLIFAAIMPVVETLEQLNVDYHIGGSVASSVHGNIRATIDADIVADLKLEHVQPLVGQLKPEYYIDADAVSDAIKHSSSFNAIHLATMLKVDVFILKALPFEQEEFRRMRQETLVEGERPFYVASPEDTILQKCWM